MRTMLSAKKIGLAAAALALLLLLAACGVQGLESGPETTLYYLTDLEFAAGGEAIQAVPVALGDLGAMEVRAAAELILEKLGESGDGYFSPLPAGVTVEGLTFRGRRVYVDLSEGYRELAGVDLSLSAFCLTLSLCQLEEIASVGLSAGGTTVPLGRSQVLMEQDAALSGMEDMARTAAVRLWFPDGQGALVQENREVELYEGQTLVEAVAEALAEGPRDRDRDAIFPQGFAIRSAWQEEGICWLSIPAESIALLPESVQAQETILQAISWSYFSLDSVRELRILVDGNEIEIFGQVPLESYRYRAEPAAGEMGEGVPGGV